MFWKTRAFCKFAHIFQSMFCIVDVFSSMFFHRCFFIDVFSSMFLHRCFFIDVFTSMFFIDVFTSMFFHLCFAFEDRFDVWLSRFQRSTLSKVRFKECMWAWFTHAQFGTSGMMAMARVHAQLVDFVDEIDGVLTEIDTVAERDDEELLESLLQTSLVLRDTLVVEDLLPDGEVLSNALCSVVRCLQEAVDEKNLSHMKGRPAICIPEEQLAMLLRVSF